MKTMALLVAEPLTADCMRVTNSDSGRGLARPVRM
jgi:hypothetical protein